VLEELFTTSEDRDRVLNDPVRPTSDVGETESREGVLLEVRATVALGRLGGPIGPSKRSWDVKEKS
jgi:hypothetical protein